MSKKDEPTDEKVKKFLKKEEEEDFPQFRRAIFNELKDSFEYSEERARRLSNSSELIRRINEDPIWAQRMGPEYWAKAIIKNINFFES